MPESAYSYLQQFKALLPVGKLWDSLREESRLFGDLLHAIAEEFSRVDSSNSVLIDEADPQTTEQLLPEWEQFASLPGNCDGPSGTVQERRAALLSRLTVTAGLSRAYIIQRAADLGLNITITETVVSVAGVLQAGDVLSANQSDIYFWQVNVPIDWTNAFVTGESVAGDELGNWQPIALICFLKSIKPAHTEYYFNYIS